MIILALLRAVQTHEIVGINPVEQTIHHVILFIQVDALVLKIFSENAEPDWIFAGHEPVDIQPPAFARYVGLVGSAVPDLSDEVRRIRFYVRMQRYFRARAG